MFHSALRPVTKELSDEEINIGLEKCFAEMQNTVATLDRLRLTREAFSQISDDKVNIPTVALFTSSFADVPHHLIPEASAVSLEFAYSSSGAQMKALALESGDGVISKIVAFIKNLIGKIRDFFKAIFSKKSKAPEQIAASAVSHRKESESKQKTLILSHSKQVQPQKTSETSIQPRQVADPIKEPAPVKEEFKHFSIKPTEDFLGLVKNGKLTENTVVSMTDEMRMVALNLKTICYDLDGFHKRSNLNIEILEGMFSDKMGDNEVVLVQEGTWPASVTVQVLKSLQVKIEETPVDKPDLPEELVFTNLSNFSKFAKNLQTIAELHHESIKTLDKIMADINKDIDKLSGEGQTDRSGNDTHQVLKITKFLSALGQGIPAYCMKQSNRAHRALEAMARKMESE